MIPLSIAYWLKTIVRRFNLISTQMLRRQLQAALGLANVRCDLALGRAFSACWNMKTFAKAGQPGWASIIPIYNMIVMLEIAGKPLCGLYLIPGLNLIVSI